MFITPRTMPAQAQAEAMPTTFLAPSSRAWAALRRFRRVSVLNRLTITVARMPYQEAFIGEWPSMMK